MQFKVRRILPKEVENEIKKIGFSPSYLNFGVLKHKFLNIKIFNLKPEAATIIKETALASNCDAAIHKSVLDHSIDYSDLILSGSVSQLETTAEKLKKQQFSMPEIAEKILKEIKNFKQNGDFKSLKPHKTKIMGILNITKDSFSDGGLFLDTKKAIDHAAKMIEDGAEIIDIGAESTRPEAKSIESSVEIERITPVIKELRQNRAFKDIKISVDTRNADTARAAAILGADIINDVSGLTFDFNMKTVIKETGLNVVIMHSRGNPQNMDSLCNYKNLADEVYFELQNRVQSAADGGINPEKIIIDPGFGFAKNNEQNFEILRRIEEFKSLGFPILAGLSRKRFIKSVLADSSKEPDINSLDDLTAQTSFYFALKGIDIVRVHNAAKSKQAIDLAANFI